MSLVKLPQPPPSPPMSELRDRWSSLSTSQRLLLLGAVCLIVSVAFWAYKMNKPDMRQLVSGLSAEDASRIVRKLDELKVNYTLTEGGGTIQVPGPDVNRVRLELAGGGLLQKGAIGFELFDRVNLNTTDFSERVNYLRAMQGELAATIQSIPAVQSARVHLNIPREAAFLTEAHKPTASVLLQLKPGVQLSRPQCRGILNLVASSVEGLAPESVTLTDTNGAFLYTGSEELFSAGGGEEDQQARQLQHTAQAVLDGVLGPGRGLVSVRVELLRDRKQTQRELFEPGPEGKPLEKSNKQTEETYQGTGRPLPGGIPTPSQPASPTPSPTPTSGSNSTREQPRYSQTSKQVEYQVSRRTETIEESPNKIRRLTASVLVDSEAKLEKAGLESLTQAVSLALGIDNSRGDQFNLKVIPFNREFQAEEKKAMEEAQVATDKKKQLADKTTAIMGGIAVGSLLLLSALVFLLGRRRGRTPDYPEHVATGANVNISLPVERPEAGAPPALPAGPADREVLLDTARKAVREDPVLVARVVQSWLDQDREGR